MTTRMINEKREEQPCDSCSNPATHMVRDICVRVSPDGVTLDRRPDGNIRYGCDAHPVESKERWI